MRWFKNGLEIHPEQSEFSVARDGALVISTASASHSGDFKCVATNEAGSVERKTRLKVNGENLVASFSLPHDRIPESEPKQVFFRTF